MRKKIFFVLVCFCLAVTAPSFLADAAYTPDFTVESESALLVNTDSGVVVYEKEADKKQDPASLTKIMTAIVTLEHVEDIENTTFTSSTTDYDPLVGKGASTADIRPGETLSVKNLLYALIMSSACEAANILANRIGGSEAGFVELMNEKAQALGCQNTHFVNAHGLYEEDQYTTARDMYLIASYAMNNPVFYEICNTTAYIMPETEFHPAGSWTIYHTNKLLLSGGSYYYPYAYGVKTGTGNTGTNLISTASRDGYHYMLVTLEARYLDSDGKVTDKNLPYVDAKTLYNWAFDNFVVKTVIEKGQSAQTVRVRYGKKTDNIRLVTEKSAVYLLPVGADVNEIKQNAKVPASIDAPVKAGDRIGEMELVYEDEVIATIGLVSAQDVQRSIPALIFGKLGAVLTSWPMKIVYVLAGLFVLFYIFLVIRYNNLKKKRRRKK